MSLVTGIDAKILYQGSCGACYAFSAVGAIEGAQALAHETLAPLSEQNIIDCSGKGLPNMVIIYFGTNPLWPHN